MGSKCLSVLCENLRYSAPVLASELLLSLEKAANSKRAIELERYFKTGVGEYAHGDIFLGITVPTTRKLARDYFDLTLPELRKLMKSQFHEARFSALVILVHKFKRANSHEEQEQIFDFYMAELRKGRINNWDLVDVSAPTIGAHLLDMRGARTFLQSMAEDENLWIRRSSILFTFASLKIGDRKPTLSICTKLLGDDHDLIHKAVGWALREVGKQSPTELRAYLERNGRKMSRTTLRYAIEKFSISERKQWLERTR